MVNFYSMGYGVPYYEYNVHQALKNRYGVGYEDFGRTPHIQEYSMGFIERSKPSVCEESRICQFIKKFLF